SIEPYREHTSVQDARRLVALDRAGYVDAIRHRAPCSDQLGHILRRVPHSIERHKPTGVLIPQRQPKRREAPPKCNDGCAVKHRILIVALLEIVVRNSRAEMVHVMEANASRDQLVYGRKMEVGAGGTGFSGTKNEGAMMRKTSGCRMMR